MEVSFYVLHSTWTGLCGFDDMCKQSQVSHIMAKAMMSSLLWFR
jgi:hypothetical protein